MDVSNQDSALLRAIMDAAEDAILIADEHGTIVRANAMAGALFRYSQDELVGHSVNKLMPAHHAHAHDGYMQHHLKTGEEKIIGIGRDLEGLRKDESVFPLHLSVGRADIGGVPMFIGICHDLSERRAAQTALARSQRLDAIGQMTGGITHDFNNLLTVIIGNLELLEMRGATDKQLPLIKDALASAEMGADLTNRLMVFARRSNLRPEEVDLRDLCAETLAILSRTLGSNIRIKTKFADQLNPVMVDPVQLQSALMNLALNARDAIDGPGELLVSLANVEIDDTYIAQEIGIETGTYVRLSVSDDGKGMDEEAQARAFEPFFTTKEDNGGTGLGLATVYGFVRQSGGHITLYSEPGHGTSFGLYFPAAPNGDGKTSSSDQKSGNAPVSHQSREQTILVVEDNPKIRKLSMERVIALGFTVLEASSGDEAYQMLTDGAHADVLFSDLVMPGSMNGYDLAVRVNAEFPHMRILLTSGYASDVVTASMAAGKPYEILHKPYRQSDLADRLNALLGGPTDH